MVANVVFAALAAAGCLSMGLTAAGMLRRSLPLLAMGGLLMASAVAFAVAAVALG